jgi:Lysyl oxidase
VRRRWAAGAALLLAGCAGEPAELLPDLVQTRPAAVSVLEEDGRYRLVFLSAVENVGAGPLVVEGTRAGPEAATMAVAQVIRRSDGSTRAHPVAAEVRYVVAETHRHWHLLAFERYELRRVDDGSLAAADRKTGFCLGDRYDADGDRTLSNEPDRPAWAEECGRGRPLLLRVRQGISPGYGDDYVPSLEGQYIDITAVPAGRYRLVHRVNPERSLRESDYSNNVASVALEIRRNLGAPPGVVVESEERN